MAWVGARRRGLLAVAAGAILVAGCGEGGGRLAVRPPATGASGASPSVTAPASPPASTGPTVSSSPAGHPAVSVAPATGLRTGQAVRVSAAGFPPGDALAVAQCADRGAQTTQADCDLAHLVLVTAGPDGRVLTDLVVDRGPFGDHRWTCGVGTGCLVSVSEARPSPTAEADATITFG